MSGQKGAPGAHTALASLAEIVALGLTVSCSPGSKAPCRSCSASSCSNRLPGAGRLYGIIAVVVVFSVVVQGSLIPSAARLLRVQMRSAEPQPWALGVRLRDEPSGVHYPTVKAGAAAGTTRPWISPARRPGCQAVVRDTDHGGGHGWS